MSFEATPVGWTGQAVVEGTILALRPAKRTALDQTPQENLPANRLGSQNQLLVKELTRMQLEVDERFWLTVA